MDEHCKSCEPDHIFKTVDVSQFCVHAELEGREKAEVKDDDDSHETDDDSTSIGSLPELVPCRDDLSESDSSDDDGL